VILPSCGSSVIATILVCLLGASSANGAWIEIIPDCKYPKIARDGSGVLATSVVFSAEEGVIRWTPDGGVERYPAFPNGGTIEAVARDGLVAVGTYVVGRVPNIGNHFRMFRWSVDGGFESLPHFFETETARYGPANVSNDGEVVVGTQIGFPVSAAEPVFWKNAEAFSPFRPLPLEIANGGAVASNEDGSVIYGWLSNAGAGFGSVRYFRWTAELGTVLIRPLPFSFGNTQLTNVAPEADLILGRGTNSEQEWQSFLHSDAETVLLPNLGDRGFVGKHVSADGRIVLGDVWLDPYLWYAERGLRNVTAFVANDLGLDLEGWELAWTMGMSNDAQLLIFHGTQRFPAPRGFEQSCIIISVPEPTNLALQLSALFSVFAVALSKSR